MAFPLDAAHIISHLRSSYLTQFDSDDEIRRVLTPYSDDEDGDVYKHIFDRYVLSESPPITASSGDLHDRIELQSHSRSIKSKRRSKIRQKKKSIDAGRITEDRDFEKPGVELVTRQDSMGTFSEDGGSNGGFTYNSDNDNDYDNDNDNDASQGTTANGHDYTFPEQQQKKPEKKKSNIIRLFQRDRAEHSDSDSDESVRTAKLHTDTGSLDSDATQKFTTTVDPQVHRRSMATISGKSEEAVAQGTLDSGTGVLSDFLKEENGDGGRDIDSDDYDKDDFEEGEEEEDDDEDEYEEEEVSSSDSAFTDIDGDDSLMDDSLLDSFETSNFEYSKKTKMLASKLRKKKSSRIQSFGSNLQSAKGSTSVKLSSSNSSSALSTLRAKKSSVRFEKIPPAPKTMPKRSNLSSLISSKNTSSVTNPLTHYNFVNDEMVPESAKKVQLDIFVPPSTIPTLKDLSVNNNVAISDCIGYILLHLSQLEEFKDAEDFSLYPNHWRLELVDEDGENYGSFGILDRSRLLSSYNNPRELAICRVHDEREIRKNEIQSPLASDFKESLVQYNRAKSDEPEQQWEQHDTEDRKIELSIVDTNGSKAYMLVSKNSSVQEVLYEFCTHRNLDPNRYSLRIITQPVDEITQKQNADGIVTLTENSMLETTNVPKRFLNKNELVQNIESEMLEIVPSKAGLIQSLLGDGSKDISPILDNTISPSPNTSMITPPVRHQLPRETRAHRTTTSISESIRQTGSEGGNIVAGTSNAYDRKPSQDSSKSKTKMDSNRYFEDMLQPFVSNAKARYFTWKVWRRKATILNKMEKTLIVDGDYIRLQPPEDSAFTTNPDDNPFLAAQTRNSHHHHLHHYNYSNYYNSTRLKTSSFHVTQIVKLKQYKGTKNPMHFKIVIQKPDKDTTIKKKYDLEAVSVAECEDIISKIRWVIDMYNREMANMK